MYPLPHHLPPLPSEEKLISPNSWMSPTHTKAHVYMYETRLPYKAAAAAVNPYAVCHCLACLRRFHSSHFLAGLPVPLSVGSLPVSHGLLSDGCGCCLWLVFPWLPLRSGISQQIMQIPFCNCLFVFLLFYTTMRLSPLSIGRNWWPRLGTETAVCAAGPFH